jgi:N6-adenosine-specific RNA methylase IME4
MKQLVSYNNAKQALALVHRVDEVKDIRDKALAMQAYAKQAQDTTMITHATEIRMRAERRAGELLRGMDKARGGQVGGRKKIDGSRLRPSNAPATLSDLKITKTQSSRWQKLAALDLDKFERHVERAGTNAYDRMTGRFLKEAEIEREQKRHRDIVEHGCTVDDLNALAESGKRFSVIYADPPWEFTVYSGKGKQRSADRHYDTHAIEKIIADTAAVPKLAADNCALFLWGVWPEHPGALAVIEAWGFEFKTVAFVWVKTTGKAEVITLDGDGLHWGMGYWTRANTECCLLATKGSPLRLARDVHQVVLATVGEHSAKPEEVRHRIEQLVGGPYLELYGRKPVPGWTVWGNEVERELFREAAE